MPNALMALALQHNAPSNAPRPTSEPDTSPTIFCIPPLEEMTRQTHYLQHTTSDI